MLKEYFPLFVRQKMIRELVFHFQERDGPLRELVKEVVDAAEFLQYSASEGEIVDRIFMDLHPDILAQAAFLPRPGSYREVRDVVGLIEERMAVLTERQRSENGSSGSQVVEKSNLSDHKTGRTASEGKQSGKNGHTCWHCGKQVHVQRNCRGRNSLGAVAVIAQNREPSVRVLDQEEVEAKVSLEKCGRSAGREIRIGTTDVVGEWRRLRPPRKRRHQRGRKKQLKVGGNPHTNPPLWIKLNFKLEEVPSLVDTGAQFRAFAEM